MLALPLCTLHNMSATYKVLKKSIGQISIGENIETSLWAVWIYFAEKSNYIDLLQETLLDKNIFFYMMKCNILHNSGRTFKIS